MKPSIWDILTGVTLLGTLALIVVFGAMLAAPRPAAPTVVSPAGATPVPTIAIPSATITNTVLPPTETEEPTPTRRPFITYTPVPTSTIFKLPTFTASPRAGGGSYGQGSCLITKQTPLDGEYMPYDQDFDMSWTIQNVSTKAWSRSSVDLRFLSGDTVHLGGDTFDLEYDVSPRSNVQIVIPMHAPNKTGDYASYWGLFDGDTALCKFFVKFKVQKP